MFSKTQGVLLFVGVIVGAGFWYSAQSQKERIRHLAATEARLEGITREMISHQRALEELSYKIRPLWEQRTKMHEATTEIADLTEEVSRLSAGPLDNSDVKWSMGATIELEEYVLPPETADELLKKHNTELSDEDLRKALMERENAVVFTRKFETVILPEPRDTQLDEGPDFTTSIYSGHPVDLRAVRYEKNQDASFASDLEGLLVFSEIRSHYVSSEVHVSIHEAAGVMLGTWVLGRTAAMPNDAGNFYDIQLQTKTPISTGRFQFIGAANFRVVYSETDRYQAKRGVLLVLARTTLHDEGAHLKENSEQ